jgi:hypothetical protein
MVGTVGRARVRLHSLLRCGVFLSKGRLPFVEFVPLGSFVPENPIAESGPVMRVAWGIATWVGSGVVGLAVSTASTPYHREDLHFQKLCGLRAW